MENLIVNHRPVVGRQKTNIVTVFFWAVNHHDNAVGPQKQCASTGAKEPVAKEPKGDTVHSQQPPHTISRALTSQVSR